MGAQDSLWGPCHDSSMNLALPETGRTCLFAQKPGAKILRCVGFSDDRASTERAGRTGTGSFRQRPA